MLSNSLSFSLILLHSLQSSFFLLWCLILNLYSPRDTFSTAFPVIFYCFSLLPFSITQSFRFSNLCSFCSTISKACFNLSFPLSLSFSAVYFHCPRRRINNKLWQFQKIAESGISKVSLHSGVMNVQYTQYVYIHATYGHVW